MMMTIIERILGIFGRNIKKRIRCFSNLLRRIKIVIGTLRLGIRYYDVDGNITRSQAK